RRRRKRKASKR
ncbi:FHIPEP family protein, partial [Escherichia coli 6.0172]